MRLTKSEGQFIAEHNTILRCQIGSTVHGLNIEGQDDTDEMGVCIEPPEVILGLKKFEQYVYRTQPEGERSGPGDLDLIIYGLRKFCSLAAGGNPTIINLFFVPYIPKLNHATFGVSLRNSVRLFFSKRILRSFIGYMDSQRNRLFGTQGQRRVNRPELIEKYGYDTKYAMHALRLGYHGLEFARTERIAFPMKEDTRNYLRDVRQGKKSLKHVEAAFRVLRAELQEEFDKTTLPDEPDMDGINQMMMDFYFQYWKHQEDLDKTFRIRLAEEKERENSL